MILEVARVEDVVQQDLTEFWSQLHITSTYLFYLTLTILDIQLYVISKTQHIVFG